MTINAERNAVKRAEREWNAAMAAREVDPQNSDRIREERVKQQNYLTLKNEFLNKWNVGV
ncbi:MAG: hypothetical protein N4A62_06775 [Marinisporobacter sp.]|jgi:hypothetical protein|nr:hypothetical protein [Marinisporobacter sp.]MCV6599656.1 hypothetical protein [Alphaproteobacteria bacterium]